MTPLETLNRETQVQAYNEKAPSIADNVEKYFQQFIQSRLFEDKLGNFDRMSIQKVFQDSLQKYQHNVEHNPYHAANDLFNFLEYQIQILTEDIEERRMVREYVEYLKEVYTVMFLGNRANADDLLRNIFCTTEKMVESNQDLQFKDFFSILQNFVKEVRYS